MFVLRIRISCLSLLIAGIISFAVAKDMIAFPAAGTISTRLSVSEVFSKASLSTSVKPSTATLRAATTPYYYFVFNIYENADCTGTYYNMVSIQAFQCYYDTKSGYTKYKLYSDGTTAYTSTPYYYSTSDCSDAGVAGTETTGSLGCGGSRESFAVYSTQPFPTFDAFKEE